MAAKEQNVTISIKVKLYPDQKTIEEFKKRKYEKTGRYKKKK